MPYYASGARYTEGPDPISAAIGPSILAGQTKLQSSRMLQGLL